MNIYLKYCYRIFYFLERSRVVDVQNIQEKIGSIPTAASIQKDLCIN